MAFLLAHLSDPHLAPLPSPGFGELAGKRVTGYLNWHRKRRFVHDAGVLDALVADLKKQKPDHIAVTGDLANIALAQEFARGREWLEALGDPSQVSLVPGNHDAYVREGLAYAAREWNDYMRGDDGSVFPYVRRRGPLALVGLSSAVPTAPLMASGRLGFGQLRALPAILDSLKRDFFRVVMIHHPPVSKARWHKRLSDAPAFIDVIAEYGAELLLHGHDHLAMLNWLAGPGGTRVPAVGVPSASASPTVARQPAGYNLYKIDGAPGAWRCDMISRGISRGVGATAAIAELQRIKI